MSKPLWLIFTLGVLLIVTPVILADNTSLRCGNSLISIGDTMYEVRSECGDPQHEQHVGERRRYRIDKEQGIKIEDITYVTEWVYEKNHVEYILTFEGSRLVHKSWSR